MLKIASTIMMAWSSEKFTTKDDKTRLSCHHVRHDIEFLDPWAKFNEDLCTSEFTLVRPISCEPDRGHKKTRQNTTGSDENSESSDSKPTI
jgi:hypothetical protein